MERPPAWIFKFNGKVPDPRHRQGASSCCLPLPIILEATAFFCCPSYFGGNLGEARDNDGILSHLLRPLYGPPPNSPPPITSNGERKEGWHRVPIGCFKSLQARSRGRGGVSQAWAGGGGQGFSPLLPTETAQVGKTMIEISFKNN